MLSKKNPKQNWFEDFLEAFAISFGLLAFMLSPVWGLARTATLDHVVKTHGLLDGVPRPDLRDTSYPGSLIILFGVLFGIIIIT